MVAALPECRGLGIGHCLITHTVKLLTERGYEVIGLTTDDFRLSAVKVYLDAGFCPYLWQDPESNMKERWERVIASLGYNRKIEFIEEHDKYNP
jgi:mycothiol synthase